MKTLGTDEFHLKPLFSEFDLRAHPFPYMTGRAIDGLVNHPNGNTAAQMTLYVDSPMKKQRTTSYTHLQKSRKGLLSV